MASQLRVLVVGASIAGPAAAYWFAKAGARVTVIERFPELRTGGQNIDIRTAGVTVMRKMAGMEPAVRAKRAPLEGFRIFRADGRPVGTIRAVMGDPDRQSVISEYEIYRGDLSRILVDLTKDNDNVKYVFNEQVASMRQQGAEDQGPVTVEFANGLPASDYDLVVACDGATSRTRAIGLGCGVRDHIKPGNCWAAYFSTKQDLIGGSKLAHGHSAVGGRFFSIERNPVGGNQAMLMAVHPRNKAEATLPFREAVKQGDDALKRFVAKSFEDAGWRIDEVLQQMTVSDDFYASEVVQVKVPSLSRGRFVLVGDAGYAPGFTGNGTSLALAGAYVLAGEIGKHRGDLAAGLRAYEQRMRPIIDEMQKLSSIFPEALAPQSAWVIWLRNSVFAFVAWTNILEYVQRFFGSAFASTEDFPLPEYEWAA